MPAAPDNSAATKADLAALKSDLQQQFGQVLEQFGEMRQQFAQVLEQFGQIREYIDERTRDMQTELLRAFVAYNNSYSIRLQKVEADTSNADATTTKRLGELEHQVTDLRIRVIALEAR